MTRIDFNGNWIVTNENGESRAVTLPDDAMIYEKRDKSNISDGACGYFTPGKYTYSKEWMAPSEYEGKHIILECEGVYQNFHVLLNDDELYFRPYGYTNYFVELTGKLNYGQNNKITIVADNSKAPNSRWYSGSGVYRKVALHVGEKYSVAPEGIKIRTISKDKIAVKVELNDVPADASSNILINILILDGDKVVAEGNGPDCEITVPNTVCWSENNPKLYEYKINILLQDKIIDSILQKFGIRTVEWNAEGLFINNEEVLLRGACVHHDSGVLGACGFADAEYRRVKILKEAGFNALRSSHNPM